MSKLAKNASHQQRSAGGRFGSNWSLFDTHELESDSYSDGYDTLWEIDTESELGDPNYFEAWETLPVLRTFEEQAQLNAKKSEKAAEKRRIAKMCSAERQEAGPADQTGKKRGPYSVGGLSKRLILEKKKQLQENFKAGLLAISQEELAWQLATIEKLGSAPVPASAGRQTTIFAMFSKALKKILHAPSVDDDIQEIPELSGSSSKCSHTQPQSNACQAAEWIHVLEDAAPPGPDELHSLALDCPKVAQKEQDYRSTVLFASLADFYHWMPRMGRLRAALHVAHNHGRGPAFQRVLAAQARFFETNGSLKSSHQGRWEKSNGLLDDEGFFMGVHRWLRTLEPGTLQQHINETLLPPLSLKKKKIVSKGVYWDGHERKDVKKCQKEYLAELKAFEAFRASYVEPNMAEVLPELAEDDVEHIVIRYGLLDLTEGMVAENEKMAADLRLKSTHSTTIIYPNGKPGGDSDWNMVQMIEQLIKAILIARRLFPKAIIHWVFNNSSAHGSLALDALTVTKMNVNPGGKVPSVCDTIIPLNNPHGHGGKPQKMMFDQNLPENHPYHQYPGLPKGMKVILAERGYTKDHSAPQQMKNVICMVTTATH
ncbi:hypothetical protein C8R45DRAFT_934397 [Mycena sanguinolenta]|nr:hypothetical protein C8R45DRAFT_934397 [Mycena sanguinolenta]